ncbi:hypothetical protein GTP81_06985 [Rugamonas sp. FT107W]|uniref:Right-handed parallel beta-helix repeat-containing protein n=1 Tax=Duganella vulcania TaxID=2692166 RepID=A0A845HFZ3_9BURK|nr:hypothetical protein [Duganella vulcania]MYN16495.1 hypothetical protein [Duganella vulcania]
MLRFSTLLQGIVFPALFISFIGGTQASVYYVDNATGSDGNDGLSQAKPWKTLARVNSATLIAGDSVLFNRGGKWRGFLDAKPGSSGNNIVYAAYGAGDKPLFLGSVALNNSSYWKETASGSHLWETQPVVAGAEQLPSYNVTYSANSPQVSDSLVPYATFSPDSLNHSAGSSSSLKIAMTGPQSSVLGNVQVFRTIGQLVAGRYYKFSFNARASQPVTLTIPSIIRSSTFANYATQVAPLAAGPAIGTSWASYEYYFYADATASDGRVTLFFGDVPTGVSLNIDSLSLREYDGIFKTDVGSLIFDDAQASVGFKKLFASALSQDGDFWYDASRSKIRLYSTRDPAQVYTQIEAAVTQHIVNGSSYVELHDLDLRYGAAHGIRFPRNTAGVVVDGLNLSYIGGGMLDAVTRYGNGVQFWETTTDAIVRNTSLSQIYDSALTAQGNAAGVVNGITFNNNYISKAEQCYELWSRSSGGVTSTLANVTFTRNTCVASGGGWSHSQRPAVRGFDVLLYANTGTASNIKITDNIFYSAVDGLVYLDLPWGGYKAIDFSGNCYYPQLSIDPALGKLLQQNITSWATEPGSPVNTKDVAVFNSAFATNTSSSNFGDPAMISSNGILKPNPVGNCSGKGYAAISGG